MWEKITSLIVSPLSFHALKTEHVCFALYADYKVATCFTLSVKSFEYIVYLVEYVVLSQSCVYNEK